MLPDQFCQQDRRHALKMHSDFRDASSSKFITNIENILYKRATEISQFETLNAKNSYAESLMF